MPLGTPRPLGALVNSKAGNIRGKQVNLAGCVLLTGFGSSQRVAGRCLHAVARLLGIRPSHRKRSNKTTIFYQAPMSL